MKNAYETGDVLCDVHDGFGWLPKNLEVVSETKVVTEQAYEAVKSFLGGRKPGNKALTIVGELSSGTMPRADLAAVYSFDNRVFGLVTLRYKDEE